MRPLLALVVLAAAAGAQDRPALTVEQITQRPETWIGAWPGEPYWTEAGDAAYFWWNPGGQFPADSLYRVGSGGEPERVPADERRALPPRFDGYAADGRSSPDGRRRVFDRAGDVWVYDRATGATARLTRTPDRERDARFLADGSVAFRQGDALFQLADGGLRQLTDLRAGRAPAETDPAPAAAFLRDQQRRLLGTVRDRVLRDSLAAAERARDAVERDAPPTFYTGDRRVGALAVDPGGRFVAFTLYDDVETERTLMVDYVTESGVGPRDPRAREGRRPALRGRAVRAGPRARHDDPDRPRRVA